MCLTVSFNCLMFCRPRQNPCGKAEDGMSQRSLLSPSTWEQGLPRQELAQEQECEVGLLPACILLGGNTRCLTSVSQSLASYTAETLPSAYESHEIKKGFLTFLRHTLQEAFCEGSKMLMCCFYISRYIYQIFLFCYSQLRKEATV